ncbi:GntR family transcriptional regulator [Caballeronia arationis]|jgi:DNA-binding GntR family transcriptional regulator|uniref:Transcriptional regulator, GntR family n=1 Tax=Caballeronia arationis TaxID=1777142 RepID=A0A7Z7N762_9BURK|nr:GntR family transcriptional regulator [Caballeronia arationis]SAK66461.1 GntR family transcriptional regulator [Caballeronia arationis]SOE88663.1 transcriptional regulator, GntR family [Caballeronia arationis]
MSETYDEQADLTFLAIARKLEPIDASAPLRKQAYTQLRQAIADADIYGSEREIRLDERKLTTALGVSRTPVREAITLLEQEGFLRTVPRRGVYITRKTRAEIIEMIHLWAALESMAARLAAERATDGEIASLRAMFHDFHEHSPADDIDNYSDANIAFHQAVVTLSKSEVISQTLSNIFAHVRAIRRHTISQSDRASRSMADHEEIIAALERRDGELAEAIVRRHSLDLAAFVETNWGMSV